MVTSLPFNPNTILAFVGRRVIKILESLRGAKNPWYEKPFVFTTCTLFRVSSLD